MISENLTSIYKELPSGVKLVAVSKFHPLGSIIEAVDAGQTVFGESRPQELEKKVKELEAMPGAPEIKWHFIGHLQTNKLKMVLPYVDMVESVDSLHLLQDIDKWGKDNGKVINVLLEMHVAAEESKQGFVEEELLDILLRQADTHPFRNVRICGLMGMATNTDNEEDVRADFGRIADYFEYLRDLCPELTDFTELSIGMSGDWKIAVEYGATIVRIGTAIFGERQY